MNNRQISITSSTSISLGQTRDQCMDWWAKHPMLDLGVTAAVIVIHLAFVYHWKFGDVLSWTGITGQTATFAAGAGVMSLIAGFAGIGITQYGTAQGEIIDEVRLTHGREIRRNWLSITSWLLTSAVLCIVAMTIDTNPKSAARWIFEVAFVVALLKFFRLAILFRLLLATSDRQASRTPERQPIRMLEP